MCNSPEDYHFNPFPWIKGGRIVEEKLYCIGYEDCDYYQKDKSIEFDLTCVNWINPTGLMITRREGICGNTQGPKFKNVIFDSNPKPCDWQGPTKKTTRGSVLGEAHKIINGDRQDQYGNPEDSFQLIADYWSLYLQDKLDPGKIIYPGEVGVMMALLKIAREQIQGKRDNLRDAVGYLALVADIEDKT
jgi:hypothetical protein